MRPRRHHGRHHHAQAIPSQPLAGAKASTAVVPIGWVSLEADDDPALSVLVELDDSPPRVIQGYGGWDEVDRPGRVSLTPWTGFKPLGVELDIYLDDFDAGRSVQPVIEIIEALAGVGRKATGGEPPLVAVDTAGVMPHDAKASPDLRWVIADLEWDTDTTIVNNYGHRVRAAAIVTLKQHVSDDRLQDRALAARLALRSKKKGGASRRYTVKAGETLVSIARHHLGDPGRWREIAVLNGLRDPRALKPGAQIRLP